jgi:DNA-binding response OmpR family regulator
VGEPTTLNVEIRFDREVSEEMQALFAEVLAEELEFRDLRDGRYQKPGWGIATARVVEVRREGTDPIRVGELALYPASRRVFVGDREVDVNAREWSLLIALAADPDVAISCEEILARAFEAESSADKGTVAGLLERLREKLADPRYVCAVADGRWALTATPA